MTFGFCSLAFESSRVADHARHSSDSVNPATLRTVFGSPLDGASEGLPCGAGAIVLLRCPVHLGGRRSDVVHGKLPGPKQASRIFESERVRVAKKCKAFVNPVQPGPQRPITHAVDKASHRERLSRVAHRITLPRGGRRAVSAPTAMSRCGPRWSVGTALDFGGRSQSKRAPPRGRGRQPVGADHVPRVLRPTDGDRRASFSTQNGAGSPAAAWSGRVDLLAT